MCLNLCKYDQCYAGKNQDIHDQGYFFKAPELYNEM